MRAWGCCLLLMLLELIGLNIIFDVDLRDVGKTPPWDMDILSPHRQGDGQYGNLVYFLVECTEGPP